MFDTLAASKFLESVRPHRRSLLRGMIGLAGVSLGVNRAMPQSAPGKGASPLGDLTSLFGKSGILNRFEIHLPHEDKSGSPSARRPLVFLFGGNGMGAVVRSSQARNLAVELARRGVAAVVLNYPNLQNASDLREFIIRPMQGLLAGEWADRHRIDRERVAAAGFSAGGLVATLLAGEYADELKHGLCAAVNYYGPMDLRLWFAFHLARAEGMTGDPFMGGARGPDEMGHTAGGPLVCRELSLKVVKKVAENLGGLGPHSLSPFSHDWLWADGVKCRHRSVPTPILGVFGTDDDNCDPLFQARLLRKMAEKTGADHRSMTYRGQHGADWKACPESVDWLLEQFKRKSSAASAIA